MAKPSGHPRPLTEENGRFFYGKNRYNYRLCIKPVKFKDAVYPYLNYIKSSVCQNLLVINLHFFGTMDRIATKYQDNWFCLTAASKKDLQKYKFQYVTYTPCTITNIRQRWAYHNNKLYSLSNGLSLGELNWTLAQAYNEKDIYLFNLDLFQQQDWANNPTAPPNLTYKIDLNWSMLERPKVKGNIAKATTFYDPESHLLYLIKELDQFMCLTSLQVKTAKSDKVIWEKCNPTLPNKENKWRIGLPIGEQQLVQLTDEDGNILGISNSIASPAFGQLFTIKKDSSFQWSLATSWQLDSKLTHYFSSTAQNVMQMVNPKNCPAPGWNEKKPNCNKLSVRLVPTDITDDQWVEWADHAYDMLSQSGLDPALGILSGHQIAMVELLTQLTLRGDDGTFLVNPFGFLYSSPQIPSGLTVSERFQAEPHRQTVTTALQSDFNAYSTITSFLEHSGQLSFAQFREETMLLTARSLARASPVLDVMETRRWTEEDHPLSTATLDQMIEYMAGQPDGTSFMLDLITPPAATTITVVETLSFAVVASDSGLYVFPQARINDTIVTDEDTYSTIVLSDVANWNGFVTEVLQELHIQDLEVQSAEVYRLDTFPPPVPEPSEGSDEDNSTIASEDELSYGNCSESSVTGLSGDGLGGGTMRVNFCDTTYGRCGENMMSKLLKKQD